MKTLAIGHMIRSNDWCHGNLSAMAFHEKAGRSQVGSWFLLDKVFSLRRVATVATLPSALSMSVF